MIFSPFHKSIVYFLRMILNYLFIRFIYFWSECTIFTQLFSLFLLLFYVIFIDFFSHHMLHCLIIIILILFSNVFDQFAKPSLLMLLAI